jgi:hypothetical protein
LYDVALAIAGAIVIGKISVLFIFLIHMVLRVTLSGSGDYILTVDTADLQQVTPQVTAIFNLKSLNSSAANPVTLAPPPLVLPQLPTQAQIDARFKYLSDTIKKLLKAELGQYELVKGNTVIKTFPSIWTKPPALPTEYRMKEKSGIEVIISRESDLSQQSAFSNVLELYEKYTLTLRQYDTGKTNQLAVTKLLASNFFIIIDQPRTVPYTQLSSGLVYETTTVKITAASWYLMT